ncbi:Carboxypeptidase regulatory-like domain-containing protein [Micromonospora echinofusca]|uniref:Carboxypeptidase regulatory-like domain-containing protein n=1 Tax=Micromonospora echinofusca TaxID=47858 RepID=A0A1C5GH79_MICEH|nr:carboxypeptidase-like regulatory domain-containing protein [Micromonospora echinofusca]SCG19118.1 Carboxypeptidase regulatory-like domain-containing protein [Micromonospora echinofusca]
MIPGPATRRRGKSVRKAVDVSTHRRAWKQRAGVVVALVVGALLAAPATPALAADVTVSPGSVTVNAGSDAAVTVQVTPRDGDEKVQISLAGLPGGVSCAGGCGTIDFNNDRPRSQLLRLRANDNAGDANVTVTVAAEGDKSGPGTATFQLGVKGKAQPSQPAPVQTVKSVSGKVVVQANGKAVPNAVVMLQDGAGKKIDTISDDDGNFRFSGSSEKPIAPGRLAVGASVGEVYATKSFDASAGQSVTGQRIALAIKVETTPSATPSATEEALPTEEPVEETPEESAEATPGAAANASNEDSGGMGSWLIILLGGLLVAAGVGTIVLLWMRRKDSGDEVDDTPAGAAAAGAVPAARGAFRGADDQTRVVNRVGATPDPTMVGGTALSDAPTMMHRPVVDDVPPDPYGAPPQPYGAAGNQQGWAGSGYGDEPAGPGGYGAAGYGNAPSSGGGYGSGGSGGGYGNAPSSGSGYGSNDYGAPTGAAGAAGYPPAGGGRGYGERYDEPTGRYTGDATQYPAPADPYATGVYQPEQGQGYGQSEPGAYGRGGESTGGYERGGYGQSGGYGGQEPPASRGGYGQPSGYDQPTSYDNQAGYGQGGYGQEPPQQRGGYEDRGGYGGQEPSTSRGGYGQPGGYDEPTGHGRPDGPPQQDRGGRRLDWLDD